jgi:Na+-driven multidrug efflux pump
VLIPGYGAVGAAWATLFSYIVLTVSFMILTQRLHPLFIQWRRLAAIVGLGIIVAFASFTMIVNGIDWIIIFGKLMLSGICIILSWRLLPIHSFKYI